MTNQQGLSLCDRFKESILDADERKGEGIDAVKQDRLDEAKALSGHVLPQGKQKPSRRPSPCLQRVDNHEKRPFTPIRQDRANSEASRSAPLPTPPRSPVTFFSDKVFGNGTEGAETTGSQEIEEIRTALHKQEAEIASLRSQHEKLKVEVRDLRKSYRNASKEVAKAVCNGNDKTIKGSKELEEELLVLLKQKDEIIDELHMEIVQKKEQGGELRERLAEAEGRLKARGRNPMVEDEAVYSGSSSKEKRSLRKGDPGWEFRRKRGEKTTPFRGGESRGGARAVPGGGVRHNGAGKTDHIGLLVVF